jgi:hypothetical protein
MKLKTLVSAMAVLGVISTAAMADAGQAAPFNQGNDSNAFWSSIVNRNQDNAYAVTLQPGQTKVTAEIATDLSYNSHRAGYSSKGGNGNGRTGFGLSVAELYFDAQVNQWAGVHVAADFDNNTADNGVSTGNSNTSAPTVDANFSKQQIFFSEAYASFNYQNMFAKVGRQYANFGSTSHSSISTPFTQTLSSLEDTGITFGATNVLVDGLYADAFIYNGTPYGSYTTGGFSGNDYSTVYNNGSQIHGYTLEAGYALNKGANAFYGSNGGNYYLNYIANMTDATFMRYNLTNISSSSNNTWTPPKSEVPGLALHADYATGPFQVLVDYATALGSYDKTQLSFNGDGTKPSAYSLQANYSWNETNPQTATIGYEGTMQTLGLTNLGTALPQSRLLVAYGYQVLKNVKARLEYAHDTDYGTGDYYTNPSQTTRASGTGNSSDSLTARLQVVF